MTEFLDLLSGICWSLVYLVAIGRGIRYKTWCLPSLAICLNFSWELLVVINRIRIGDANGLPFYIQLSWLVLDIVVLATWLIYEDRRKIYKSLLTLTVVFVCFFFLALCAGHWAIIAFSINAVMSGAFIYRKKRDTSLWVSRHIAVLKLIGTMAATILNGIIQIDPIILWLGGICLIFDIYYVVMLYKKDFSKR